MTDLDTGAVERLRSWADWYVSCACGNVPTEAADAYAVLDALDKLQAEVERLEKEAASYHDAYEGEKRGRAAEVERLTTESRTWKFKYEMCESLLTEAQKGWKEATTEIERLREDQFTIREVYKAENDKRAAKDAKALTEALEMAVERAFMAGYEAGVDQTTAWERGAGTDETAETALADFIRAQQAKEE